jgi:UDP-N-acetylglucosamine--N-acetylmuramyl-(pentapeptide) pyrophosphoryl-undecaprenol N-acetylglucosamine transferase
MAWWGGAVRVVITGGGTGGHVYPGLAVSAALRARTPEAEILFVGSASAMEAKVIPRSGYPFRGLQVARVSRVSLRARMEGLLRLPGTVREAAGILKEFGADVVFGVGGYASVSTVLAAARLGIPRVLHEQNAFPGLANRWLGRIASAVAVSFPGTVGFFPRGRATVTGNPIRPEIRPADKGTARTRLGLAADRFTVLVFGGSQGAHRLNQAVLEALREIGPERDRLQFVHGTGEKDRDEVRRAYADAKVAARVEAFFEEMATIYQAADFAICRAGAGTVFELAALGLPGLLVPYPHAANDHQRLNAEAMVEAGAAWVVSDQRCDGDRVAASLRTALERPDQLRAMGDRARALARPEAADAIVDLLEAAARRA